MFAQKLVETDTEQTTFVMTVIPRMAMVVVQFVQLKQVGNEVVNHLQYAGKSLNQKLYHIPLIVH